MDADEMMDFYHEGEEEEDDLNESSGSSSSSSYGVDIEGHPLEGNQPDAELSFTALAERKDQEGFMNKAWCYVKVRQLTTVESRKRKSKTGGPPSDETLPEDVQEQRRLREWYNLDIPASERSVVTLLNMPGDTLLLILRWCTFGDLRSLMCTCKLMYHRMSGKQLRYLDLSMMADALEALRVAVMSTYTTGDVELLRPVLPTVNILGTAGSSAESAIWNWGKYFAMAPRMPIWPTHSSRKSVTRGSVAFASMNKRTADWWSDVKSLDEVRRRLRRGIHCADCLRSIPTRDAMPLSWYELKATGAVLCYVCMTARRELRPAIKFFSDSLRDIPLNVFHAVQVGQGLAPTRATTVLDQTRTISCRSAECIGEIKIKMIMVEGEPTRLGIGYCTSEEHRSMFAVYSMKGSLYACPEEMDNFHAAPDDCSVLRTESVRKYWSESRQFDLDALHYAITGRQQRARVRVKRQRK